jgi:hypothetical protein
MPSIAANVTELSSAYAAGSSAFAALIWWVVPAAGLLGGIAYVVWVSKFKRKFESETSRSVGQFQRFQESFREEPLREEPLREEPLREAPPAKPAVDEKPDFIG